MPALLGNRIKPVRIACINHAKSPLGVSLQKLTAELQKCYDEHFLPVWGYPVKLYNTQEPKPTDWQLIYFDNAKQAGFIGRHDITHNGQPVSKIFVETLQSQNEQVSVVASHELFEMVTDPMANLWADKDKRTQYAYEMCDAVEEDHFTPGTLPMSNFVYPSWFEPFEHPRGTKFDHMGRLKAPFTMTEGGYVIIRRDGKVMKKFSSNAKAERFAGEDRRGHRSEFRDPRGKHIRKGRLARGSG